MQQQIKNLLLPLGLIAIASVSYVFGSSFVFFGSKDSLNLLYFIGIAISMPIGFILIPHYLAQKRSLYFKGDKGDVTFSFKSYLVVAVVIFLINHFLLGSEEYFQQMIISLCEEFLFRFVIYKILRKSFSYWSAILISSLLFGLVLHLNYPFLDNLIIRAPLGFLFSILATKFGLQYAIGGHWIYNLLQSIL